MQDKPIQDKLIQDKPIRDKLIQSGCNGRRDQAGIPTEAATFYYLLHQRPSKGLLAGMWEFPTCAGEGEQGREALTALLSGMGVAVGNISRRVRKIRHVFSHKIWQMAVYTAEAATVTGECAQVTAAKQSRKTDPADRIAANPDAATLPNDWRWVPVAELEDYNLAGPHNRILRDGNEPTTK